MSERPNPHIPYNLNLRPHHNAIAQLVSEYTDENSSVLDIGCGTGHISELIQQNKPGLEITIADIDQQVLDITQAKVKVKEAIQIEGVESLFALGKKYDMIIMSHVLEHTFRPRDVVCGIMEHLLNKDGYLVIAVPNLGRPEVSIFHLIKRHYVNKGHVYGWDRSHWMNFLENIMGLDVVKYQPDYVSLPYIKKFRRAAPFLVKMGRWFPWYSYSNIALIKQTKCKQ